jgi:hypothetical protein
LGFPCDVILHPAVSCSTYEESGNLGRHTLVMYSSLGAVATLRSARKFLALILLFPLSASSTPVKRPALGIAWKVQGTWQVDGNLIRSGDAVKPASLLQPGNESGSHSIIVLLPDGQRVLYECFTPADCARGFRVPSLTSRPDGFAINMLARIQSVLAARHEDTSGTNNPGRPLPPPRDEAVAVLDSKNHVHVAGLIAQLPNGRYTYDLQPLDRSLSEQHHLLLEKTQRSVDLTLPAVGIYTLTITDALNTPRVDLFLAAIRPAQSIHFQLFSRAKERMEQWNDDYAGWPIDDFLRAYLESLMQSAKQSHIQVR